MNTQPLSQPDRRARYLFFGVLCISFFAILICNALTPYLTDDYYYGVTVREARSLFDLVRQERDQYLTWNGRSVVHFLLRVTLLLPKPVFKICNSVVFVLLSLLLYQNVTPRKAYDARILTLLTLFLWFGTVSFPETILWQTGACNYLWGSTIILGFVTLFRHLSQRPDTAQKNATRVPLAAGLFLFGLLAGWCNENTSGGGLLLTLFFLFFAKGQRSKKDAVPLYAGVIGQFAGLLIMIASPGARLRGAQAKFEEQHDGLIGLLARAQKITLQIESAYFLLLLLFLFLLFLCLAQKKKAADLKTPLLFFFVFLATCYALVLTSPAKERALFGAGLFLMIAAASLFQTVAEDEALLSAIKNTAVAAGVLFFFFFFLREGAHLARIYREMSEREAYILEQVENGATASVTVAQLRPLFQTPLSAAYDSDLSEDPDDWINYAYEIYYGVDKIIAVDRETWEALR